MIQLFLACIGVLITLGIFNLVCYSFFEGFYMSHPLYTVVWSHIAVFTLGMVLGFNHDEH